MSFNDNDHQQRSGSKASRKASNTNGALAITENDQEAAIYAADTLCGIGSWKPAWLQPFGTAKFFVINFCIMAVLQGALFTYMVGIMSTLEKRFAFETKISGFILIADNISQMFIR